MIGSSLTSLKFQNMHGLLEEQRSHASQESRGALHVNTQKQLGWEWARQLQQSGNGWQQNSLGVERTHVFTQQQQKRFYFQGHASTRTSMRLGMSLESCQGPWCLHVHSENKSGLRHCLPATKGILCTIYCCRMVNNRNQARTQRPRDGLYIQRRFHPGNYSKHHHADRKRRQLLPRSRPEHDPNPHNVATLLFTSPAALPFANGQKQPKTTNNDQKRPKTKTGVP